MTPLQTNLLYAVYAIELEQPATSVYFSEGTSSDNFGDLGDYPTIESAASGLVSLGYLTLHQRSTTPQGLLLTQTGRQWVISDTATKKAASDAAAAIATTTANKTAAKSVTDISDATGYQWRALALILLDELNALREWDVAFKGQVAQASTLADLKSRVATLPNLPDRTLAQLKTAYAAKIDGGNAD